MATQMKLLEIFTLANTFTLFLGWRRRADKIDRTQVCDDDENAFGFRLFCG